MTITPNPLTPRVLAEMAAQAKQSLVTHIPQELAIPLIAAAMRAYEAGLVTPPSSEPTQPPPIDQSARTRI